MGRTLTTALVLLICPTVTATQFKHSIGFGLPYAGIAGYQLAIKQNQHQYRAAVGFIGASVGYDYHFDQRLALGATYTETLRPVYSINLSYQPSFMDEGARIGIDYAYMPDTTGEGFFYTAGSKKVLWVNIGYTF